MNEGDFKSPLQWWKDHEKQFPSIAFFAWIFLGILETQIEIV